MPRDSDDDGLEETVGFWDYLMGNSSSLDDLPVSEIAIQSPGAVYPSQVGEYRSQN